jgi:hypothetical protein
MRHEMLIERHLIGPMAPPPEAVTVPRLVDGNTVNPRAKARLTAEAMDRAEDAQEDFLRQIERFVAVAEQVHRQLHNHALMLGDEFRAGELLAGRAPLHQRGLSAADVGPTGDARLLHRDFHYTNLDPAPLRWFLALALQNRRPIDPPRPAGRIGSA